MQINKRVDIYRDSHWMGCELRNLHTQNIVVIVVCLKPVALLVITQSMYKHETLLGKK